MILLILLCIFYLGGGIPFLIELIGKIIGLIVDLVSWVLDQVEKISTK